MDTEETNFHHDGGRCPAWGMPRLLYTKTNCNRETRLQQLVSEMKSPEITVGPFDASGDLAERLRDDISALVAEYFLTGMRWKALLPTAPGQIAEQLAPSDKRIRRPIVEAALLSELAKSPLVIITGTLGAGKTVLLATLAEQHSWVFIQCGERTPREILAEAANGLRKMLGLPGVPYAQVEQATLAFRAAWQTLDSVTLILDDVRTEETASIVIGAATISSNRRIALSVREHLPINGATIFSLKPFDRNESAEFIAKNRAQPLIAGELENLDKMAVGNPLYLRYYTAGNPGIFETNLKEYELNLWRTLKPRSREALSYLALSPRALQLEQLLELMSSEAGSPEEIIASLSEAKSLISESSSGYFIFHSHLKDTIKEIVKESPQRRLFYAKRLARWYQARRDYISAFAVLNDAGVEISQRLVNLAGRHAAVQGNVSAALQIFQRQIDTARRLHDFNLTKDLLVSFAQALSHAGKMDEALAALDEAETLPASRDSAIPVKEVRLSILGWARGDNDAIREMIGIKNQYLEDGRDWDAARVAIELSASFIRRGDHGDAAVEADFAKAIFEKYLDSYGLKIAKLNLLSALSGAGDKPERVNELMNELSRSDDISPRQRAALCNVLARRSRENDDVEGAKSNSKEAIQIGEDLGDISIICINRANLGNAFKQEGDLDAALEQYQAADKLAHEARLTQLEAWTQRLIASLLNRKRDGNLAIQYARYAIGLAKDGVSLQTEADAYEELAEGCELIEDLRGAREAWVCAAELRLPRIAEKNGGAYAFLRAARLFQKENALQPYLLAYRRLFKDQLPARDSTLSTVETLFEDTAGLLNLLPEHFAFDAAVYHTKLIFDEMPKVLAKQFYIRLVKSLMNEHQKHEDTKRYLRAALAVSMAIPSDILSVNDLVEIGQSVSECLPAVSFRAHQDGAAHWALKSRFARPVIITVSQLDDRQDVSLVSLCLVLMLLAFSEEISSEVLAGVPPPRTEANIQIVEFEEARRNLRLEAVGLSTMDQTCVISRAVDPKSDAKLPIVVITRSDITSDWLVGRGRSNSGQMLFAKTLVELVYHLFAGEIELESLYPKIVELIKKTVV